MQFEVVQNVDDDLIIKNENGESICRLEFYAKDRPDFYPVKHWLETLPNPPMEVTVMVEEMIHTIECLTERYTNIYPADRSMPWYWVRAVQTIEKAREWLGE